MHRRWPEWWSLQKTKLYPNYIRCKRKGSDKGKKESMQAAFAAAWFVEYVQFAVEGMEKKV